MLPLIFLICAVVTIEVSYGQNAYPPTVELIQCTEAIWAADTNSFPPEELQYDLEGTVLFTNVVEDRFETGAYPSFRSLLSQFNPRIGEADPDLTVDIETFLDAVLATGPMQEAYQCLVNPDWGHVENEEDFRNQLRQYWFLKFSRSGGDVDDSSGFEHVFQGQISEDGSETTGFHGWVNSYDSEQIGNFTYGNSEADCGDGLVQINSFQYQSSLGDVSSIWIGRSPELQFALYSVCFLTRRNQNCNFEVTIDGSTKQVTVFSRDMEVSGQDTIDVLFPECENDAPPASSTTTPPGGDLSECSEAIWSNDTNSFLDEEIEYNLAGPDLFTYVNESRFQTGVYPLLRDLLGKFNPQIGEPDPELDTEITAFIDAAMSTGPMQAALECLVDRGVVENEAEFDALIREYWFVKYSRSGGNELDSSGFEHVFQGEIREDGSEITGWHNWVRTYDTEQDEDFTYGNSEDDCGDGLVQLNNYFYQGAVKPISSIWIGKSAELELALYTICFALDRNGYCQITVDGGRQVEVVNYDLSGSNQIGTAYPFC